MTRKELLYLKPGDKCIVRKGVNKDRTVIVISSFEEFVTVKPADGKRFNLTANSTAIYDIEVFNYRSLNVL